MKLLDLMLNAIITLTVTVFLAYLGYHHWDFGIFLTLPDEIAGFFLRHGALQHVALGLLVAAVVAKVPVGRSIRRDEVGSRT